MPNLRVVPDTAPRAVLYLRQSTYREESISLELQETAGRDYCARQGYTVVAVEADPGVSGRTWKRPAVNRVMALVEGGDADVIVLWRWSRLSRSRKDWAVAADRVDVAGGRIESATEPNDVTAAGRFARGVMTELAAFESERIGEQWKEVQTRRRSLGLPGGGKIPYGWQYQPDGSVAANPDQGPAVVAMYDLYLAGAGIRQIARWLEDHGYRTYHGRSSWAPTSITQTLDSPFHAGYVVHHGETLAGAHTGLIDAATYEKYRALRRERADQRTVKNRYLLSGIARCATCDAPMYGLTVSATQNRSREPYFGYRCATVSQAGQGDHGPSTMSTRVVDRIVLQWLSKVSTEIDSAAPVGDPHIKLDAQRVAREITTLDKQAVTLTEGLTSGLVPERAYRSTMESLEAKRAVLVDTLRAMEDRIVLAPSDPVGSARALTANWHTLSVEAKRQSLRELLLRVDVDCRSPRSVTVVPRWGSPVVTAV